MALKTITKMPRVPKRLQAVFALLALLIIIGFIILITATIYNKTSDLLGLTQKPIANCTDTDGGNIQTEFGTCIDSKRQQYNDGCVLTGLREEYKLQEWFCNTTINACQSEIKDCMPGFVCIMGKCISG